MMTSFQELAFDMPSYVGENRRARAFFPNGYGASIVQGPYSYGGADGLFELAVLEGSEDNWTLCYGTPITEDVVGHLQPADVDRLLTQIEALPAKQDQQP